MQTLQLSDRLCIGPAGLLRFNPQSGDYYAVHGLKTYDKNGFIHELTDPLPMNYTPTQSQLDGYDIKNGERPAPRPAHSRAAKLQLAHDLVIIAACAAVTLFGVAWLQHLATH